jgi:hypothetical protein
MTLPLLHPNHFRQLQLSLPLIINPYCAQVIKDLNPAFPEHYTKESDKPLKALFF